MKNEKWLIFNGLCEPVAAIGSTIVTPGLLWRKCLRNFVNKRTKETHGNRAHRWTRNESFCLLVASRTVGQDSMLSCPVDDNDDHQSTTDDTNFDNVSARNQKHDRELGRRCDRHCRAVVSPTVGDLHASQAWPSFSWSDT